MGRMSTVVLYKKNKPVQGANEFMENLREVHALKMKELEGLNCN